MFKLKIWNNNIIFNANKKLFSPNHADKGTLLMLKNIDLKYDYKVLDLGCGYGLVGIAIAKVIGGINVYMVDKDELAIESSRINSFENGVSNVNIKLGESPVVFDIKNFSLILCNPPYHSDFSTAKIFIEKGFQQLKNGGRMIFVVKRLNWYKNKLKSVFGGVKIIKEDNYYILISEKRNLPNKSKEIKKTTKKHLKKLQRNK
ncbi:MAG: methyltransferase [Clostridiales bacterium]